MTLDPGSALIIGRAREEVFCEHINIPRRHGLELPVKSNNPLECSIGIVYPDLIASTVRDIEMIPVEVSSGEAAEEYVAGPIRSRIEIHPRELANRIPQHAIAAVEQIRNCIPELDRVRAHVRRKRPRQ